MPYILQRIAAIVALVVLSPILVVVAVLIMRDDGRPVIYRGERVGRAGARFEQLKFRSMIKNADDLLDSIDADVTQSRVTNLGARLRRLSIDELPQLVNVARGQMAIVGPRPLLPDLLDRIPLDHERFLVLPGVTGLAQVAGRNEVLWSERLRLDAQYATSRSIRLDVKILWRTVKVVFTQQGVAADRNPGQVLDI